MLTTRIHICSFHYLMIIKRKVKILKLEDKIKNACIFSFTLLQNSTNIVQFETYLIHIYNMFMSPRLNPSCYVSINLIRKELKLRSFHNEIDLTVQDVSASDMLKYVMLSPNLIDSIKQNSPFTGYFSNLISRFSEILLNNNYNCTNHPINTFYCPAFTQIIISRLYNVSMWSGFLIHPILVKYNI